MGHLPLRLSSFHSIERSSANATARAGRRAALPCVVGTTDPNQGWFTQLFSRCSPACAGCGAAFSHSTVVQPSTAWQHESASLVVGMPPHTPGPPARRQGLPLALLHLSWRRSRSDDSATSSASRCLHRSCRRKQGQDDEESIAKGQRSLLQSADRMQTRRDGHFFLFAGTTGGTWRSSTAPRGRGSRRRIAGRLNASICKSW